MRTARALKRHVLLLLFFAALLAFLAVELMLAPFDAQAREDLMSRT